jgi:hypothetical protein
MARHPNPSEPHTRSTWPVENGENQDNGDRNHDHSAASNRCISLADPSGSSSSSFSRAHGTHSCPLDPTGPTEVNVNGTTELGPNPPWRFVRIQTRDATANSHAFRALDCERSVGCTRDPQRRPLRQSKERREIARKTLYRGRGQNPWRRAGLSSRDVLVRARFLRTPQLVSVRDAVTSHAIGPREHQSEGGPREDESQKEATCGHDRRRGFRLSSKHTSAS